MKKLSYIYPFFLLFIVIFICHFFTEKCADDIRYMHALDNQSYKEFISHHYFQWSSRILIDSTIVLLSRLNMWIWRILDSVFFVLIAYFIFKLFGGSSEKYSNYVICIFNASFSNMDAELDRLDCNYGNLYMAYFIRPICNDDI